MRNGRRAQIDRSDIDESDVSATTLSDVDAALYGKLTRVDSNRRAVERTRFGAFKLTATGLEVSQDKDLREDDWREAGDFIFKMETGIQWLIGDWLIYGAQLKYGDVKQIAESLGRDEHTLYNYIAVCKSVESSRRRELLSFSHHYEVMGLSNEDQEFALNHAVNNKLALKPFRTWLRAWQAAEKGRLPMRALPIYGTVERPNAAWNGLGKLLERDPLTYKPKDKQAISEYLAQIKAWIAYVESRENSS